MKIALVQFNPTVGDLVSNVERMLEFYQEADAAGADLVVFPEMAVCGYPIEDLAQSRHFVRQAEYLSNYRLIAQVAQFGKAAILFGTILANGDGPDENPYNAALFFDPQTMVRRVVRKYELPNYGVFDEKRVFSQSSLADIQPINFRGKRLGVMICEDMWFSTVTDRLREQGVDAFIAINGSPFEVGKDEVRRKVALDRLRYVGETFIYVNMVGGQDELVFDGGSFVIQKGGATNQFAFFKEGVEYFGFDRFIGSGANLRLDPVAAIYSAVVLGTRDYFQKGGFKSCVLGMSGGVDSALVAAIAADALGPDKVNLVRLPSKYSSEGSLKDAEQAAKALGASQRTIPIEGVVAALRAAYETGTPGKELTGAADENIQARARGNILMSISNQEGHLLLTTGNKSEVSVGYATLYGDMAGGFNPIKDCYKTTVFDMCRYRNSLTAREIMDLGFLGRMAEVVPERIISKPPSAELKPDQKDSDSLPDYPVLDSILKGLIENRASIAQVVDKGHDEKVVRKVRRLLDVAEYKRRQAAPGVKITSKLHGRDRRVPIINHFVEPPLDQHPVLDRPVKEEIAA